MKITHRAGTQDVSWFLDQYRLKRLDLDPPYQRRSVWTSGDRRYFLDTIFRGFPCPPIYLHKTIDGSGVATFHVVDGKQRIETIIKFAIDNKLRIPTDFGDERLNNKRWKDVVSDPELRNVFLNYPFMVEYFDDIEGNTVNAIFERINKNSKKLTQQELRNARFDGWFSREIASEVDEAVWRAIGIVTPGRARRMADAQFIAELFMIIGYQKIVGFEHTLIDQAYADFENPDDSDKPFDANKFKETLSEARRRLTTIIKNNPEISDFCSSNSNMYTLWAVLVLDSDKLPDDEEFGALYRSFMAELASLGEAKKRAAQDELFVIADNEYRREVLEYYDANQSATTELPQRTARLNSLRKALKLEN